MVKDAEANAEADKKRRELVEVQNQGESLIHATEKSVKEYGDKVSAADKGAHRDRDRRRCKAALEGEDVEAIKARTNDLMQASMKLGEAMYAASQAGGWAGGGRPGPRPRRTTSSTPTSRKSTTRTRRSGHKLRERLAAVPGDRRFR